jgi:OmpA-OmpF porin, OOP family
MTRVALILLFSYTTGIMFAQKSILTPPINSVLYNETDPILNGKGNVMILKTESAQETDPYWSVSTGSGNTWTTPSIVDALNFSNKTIKNLSPSLNFDGSKIFFSSNRFGGIGSGDIWLLTKSGASWAGKPTNIGMPVNSKEFESDPYFAPDEKTLYFVRYTNTKTTDGQLCGDIYTTTLSGKNWTKPQKLPAPINTGCECSPQMLNDNKTLIFASQRSGGKGSYDMYMSRLNEDGTWDEPQALVFHNTKDDDRGISIPGQGNIMYSSIMGKSSKDIQREVLTTQFQPLKTLVLTTKALATDGSPINSKLTVKNLTTNYAKDYLLFNDRENLIFLHTPNVYEIVYQDPSHKYLHHTEYKDLSSLKSFEYKSQNITLIENHKAWQTKLENLLNEDYSINTKYSDELKRINTTAEEKNDTLELLIDLGNNTQIDSLTNIILHQNIAKHIQKFKILFPNENESNGNESNPATSKDVLIRFKKE